MNSDNSHGRTKSKIDSKRGEILHKKFLQFKQIFNSQQQKFATSKQTTYYIVSSKYLKQWAQFCGSTQSERYEPMPMNQDLMDAGGQLRQGLVQQADFEVVTEKIFDLIKGDTGYVIQRQAVFVNQEKRVPVYLTLFKYLKLDSKDVYNIDHKYIKVDDLKFKIIEASNQQTIQKFILKIRRNQNLSPKNKIRLWKNNVNDISLQKLHKYIKQKTERITVYRFDGLGKQIQKQDAVIEDLNIEQGDYFIAEVSDDFSSFFFKSPDQAKCQGCYKFKKLTITCGCKVVQYCTAQCQQKDRRFHIRDCKYAEQQQLNQQVQMKITPSSALGKVGLSNLGNTCFMNSCLQCLSNTTLLTQYFIKRLYQNQINKQNPLGSKGRLARNYAKFIKNMWCQSQSTYSPHNLKGAVAKLNPIFSGFAQHDSQQFFSFLVDGLHEDLNRVLKKPYVQSVQSNNRKDEVVALQSWLAYTQRNQSIIVDLMTGQYKSKVICPKCNLQSVTFDPFTTVSLPIPEEPTQETLKFYVIFNNSQRQALRLSIQYTKYNVKQWLQTAAKILKRQPEDFAFYVLTVSQNIYNFETSSKAQILQKIDNQNKNSFLVQLNPQQRKIKNKLELVTKFCKKSYYQKQYENLWFKRPFFFQKQTTTVQSIYKRLLKYIASIFVSKKSVKSQEQYFQKMLTQKPFTLALKYKKVLQRFYSKLEIKFQKQILLEDFNMNISQLMQNFKITEQDCQLDVRFSKDSVKLFDFDKLKKFSEGQQAVSSSKKSSYGKNSSTVTLDQCFSVFEQKQQLEKGNQWYCPRCKQHRLATKQMTIYKAPQILILHLKRFKNKSSLRKQKNQATVLFPHFLNIQKYVIDPKPMSSYIDQMKKQQKYIQPSFETEFKSSSPDYELYAISNHYGGLGGGHYTAYAKNKGRWLEYNDSSVHAVSEDSITGSGAYMLFYRRKDSMNFK